MKMYSLNLNHSSQEVFERNIDRVISTYLHFDAFYYYIYPVTTNKHRYRDIKNIIHIYVLKK
jgi:hypothetical protein